MAELKKGLRTAKRLILPRLDNIEDLEVKNVLEELFRALQDINYDNYTDHIYLKDRIKELEE